MLQDNEARVTLAEAGTPWAEQYTASGRFTGHLAAEPVRYSNGDVADGWCWVGSYTREEFLDECAEQMPA